MTSGAAAIAPRLGLVALLATYALAAHAAGNPGPEEITAWVRQATAYEHGEGVPRDFERAADLYCRAARAGDARAQFSLGWMYANGRGLGRSDAAAGALFALAADQGHPQAARMLRFTQQQAPVLPDCMKPPPATVAEADDLLLDPNPSPEKKRIIELVNKLAPNYAVDPRLALAVISVESNFNPKAVSPKNAGGVMQLIPETAERFNVTNVFDPAQNIRGGLAYLRWLLAYYQGRVALAAAAYNAGEGAVDRHRGIPPYRETQTYVARVMKLFKRDDHPYDEAFARPSPVLAGARD
jgi:soluble lytic murein transglycosylase-like protein